MNILLSYPRSGNTWLRYCIEYLTKRPTLGYQVPSAGEIDKKPIAHFAGFSVQNTEPIFHKRHSLTEKPDKLIFLLRNYKEAVVRHCTDDRGLNQENIFGETRDKGGIDYISLIKSYHYHSGSKHLVFYSDLIEQPKNTLSSILKFLDQSDYDKDLDLFIENIEEHRKRAVEVYNAESKSYTEGKTLVAHRNHLSQKEREAWEQQLRSSYPDIYDTYLRRFEEHYDGEKKRYDYPLNENSVVIDAGGYRGDFAAQINDTYGCKVIVFEPVPEYYRHIENSFRDNDCVAVVNSALAGQNKKKGAIYFGGDESGVYADGEKIVTSFVRASDYINHFKWVDLLKLNVEGMEYEILENLVKTGAIKKIKNIQVQFHKINKDPETIKCNIQQKLEHNHEQQWCFDWVWESWKLRE